jgi:hypothetical protein
MRPACHSLFLLCRSTYWATTASGRELAAPRPIGGHDRTSGGQGERAMKSSYAPLRWSIVISIPPSSRMSGREPRANHAREGTSGAGAGGSGVEGSPKGGENMPETHLTRAGKYLARATGGVGDACGREWAEQVRRRNERQR